jgi:hypothetical protein
MFILKKFIVFLLAYIFLTNIAISQGSGIVYPTGGNDGVIRYPGSCMIISWTPKPVEYSDSIKIMLWEATDNTIDTIGVDIQDSIGYFIWEIPDTLPLGDKYKIKVGNDSSGYLVSFEFFSIIEEPEIPGNDKGLSVNEIIESSNIKLFPNPAINRAEVSWKMKDIKLLNITDRLGKVVYSQNVSNAEQISIPLDNIISGVYYVVLITDRRKFFFEKLIISK